MWDSLSIQWFQSVRWSDWSLWVKQLKCYFCLVLLPDEGLCTKMLHFSMIASEEESVQFYNQCINGFYHWHVASISKFTITSEQVSSILTQLCQISLPLHHEHMWLLKNYDTMNTRHRLISITKFISKHLKKWKVGHSRWNYSCLLLHRVGFTLHSFSGLWREDISHTPTNSNVSTINSKL